MIKELRKTSSPISITYSKGDFSNNLLGTNFKVDNSHENIVFSIDLSSNNKVRNKDTNSYYDVNDLLIKHSELETLQIFENKIIYDISLLFKNNKSKNWELELIIAEKGTLKYKINKIQIDGNITFHVNCLL